MARRFVAASSHYAQVAAARVTAYPLTMACWYRPTTSAASMVGVSIGRLTGAAPNHYFALGVTAAAKPFVAARAGGTESDSIHATSVANGTWGHLAGVFTSATSRDVYFNGLTPVNNATSTTPTLLDCTSIGALQNGTTRASFANADVCEVAIWNVALTAAEVLMLSLGVSPLLVRPASLVCYVPVGGINSPEQDAKVATGFTVTGATAIDHARVFDSHSALVIPFAAAGRIKTISGLARASVKTIDGRAMATVKTVAGLAA